MRLDLKFPSGFRIGVASYTVASGETNGHKIWRFGSRMMAGVQQFSRVEADYDSLKPLHSRWKHVLIADAEAVYSPGRAEVKLLTKDTSKTVDLQGVIYDNERSDAIIPAVAAGDELFRDTAFSVDAERRQHHSGQNRCADD